MVTTVATCGNDTNIFTNINTTPHITHDIKVVQEAVSEGNVVSLVLIFFGEYIGTFYLALYMLDMCEVFFSASCTVFSLICRFLIPFVVIMWSQLMLSWLSLYMPMGADINYSFRSISSKMLAM